MCLTGKTNFNKIQVAPDPKSKTGKLAVFVKDELRDGQNGGDNSEYRKVSSYAGLAKAIRDMAVANLKAGKGDKAVLEVLAKLPLKSR